MDKKFLWWIFGVTKGGVVRAKIVRLLHDRPRNANQLAKKLKLDYTTVRYHLNILLKHGIVEASEHTYIVMYFPSDIMVEHWDEFVKIYESVVND
ncbi:MAG TPA: ArsR family transcriptional regulator [Euryarchaeota archaeon]|nr:bacterial regulatory protein, arsR family [archaeon BMS3Bbin15]HDL15674.1 ArsR family transcriptional regulator [Euryarchaeota archaeon]